MQGRRPCPRSAERGTLLMLHKDQEGGLRGKPYQGVSPFLFSSSACAPIRWEVVDGLSCHSTPFLWCLPKETVSSRQRKALFYPGGSTIRVSATALVVVTFLARLGSGAGGCLGAQVSLTQSVVMLGLRVRGRGGRDPTAAVAAPKSAFLWGSSPFLCARAKKWGGTGRGSAVYCLIKRRTRKRRKLGIRLFFTFVRVRRYVGRWSLACPAIRPHFFGACPKKRCRAAKEKRFFTSVAPPFA